MDVFYITVRSITVGQRAEQILRKNGLFCLLQRTPRWMEELGCGYCIQVPGRCAASAVGLLRKHQISFRRVYRTNAAGEAEEVQL